MSRTQVSQKQVGGTGFADLKKEMESLNKNVGHFKGRVDLLSDLDTMAVGAGSQVFVEEMRGYYEFDGTVWAPITSAGSGSGSGDVSYSQVTKLGVVATPENPRVTEIEIPETVDFKRAPLEVLKFIPGVDNQISTLMTFDNADETDFEANDNVIFDGKMRLRTNYTIPMTKQTISEGNLFSATFSKAGMKRIEKIEVI